LKAASSINCSCRKISCLNASEKAGNRSSSGGVGLASLFTLTLINIKTRRIFAGFIMADLFALPFSISPIILLVAGHYRRTAEAFSRRRMLVSEAANIASTLKIQRLIFRAANRTLLGHCVGEELAAQMQDNECHLLWADRSLEVQLRQKLGDSLEATTEALKLIEEQLQRLDRYRQKLESTELETKQACY
jgi:hypothetical protein